MSSNQEDETSKDNEDLLLKSPETCETSPQMDSNDQVDRSISPEAEKDQLEPLKDLDDAPDVTSSKSATDSGFKDLGTVATNKTDFETSSDDEDLHLKWDEDDIEEPEDSSAEKNNPEVSNKDGDLTKEGIDENVLLESPEDSDKNENILMKSPEDSDKNESLLLKSPEDNDKIEDSMDVDDKPDVLKPDANIDDIDKLLNSDDDDNIKEQVTASSNVITEDDDNSFQVISLSNVVTGDLAANDPEDERNNVNDESLENSSAESKTSNVKTTKQEEKADEASSLEKTKESTADVESEKPNDVPIIASSKEDCAKNDSTLATSSPNESLNSSKIDAITDHGLNKPDVMLEIPTQEVIDIMDDTDISLAHNDDYINMVSGVNESQKSVVAMIDCDEVPDRANESTQLAKGTEETVVLNSNVFEVDLKEKDQTAQPPTVSEDDWTEIERQLKGFETSLVEDDGKDSSSKANIKSKDDIAVNATTSKGTETGEGTLQECLEGDSKSEEADDSESKIEKNSKSEEVDESESKIEKDSKSEEVGDSEPKIEKDSKSEAVDDSESKKEKDSKSGVVDDSESKVEEHSKSEEVDDSEFKIGIDSKSTKEDDSNTKTDGDTKHKKEVDSKSIIEDDSKTKIEDDSKSKKEDDSKSKKENEQVKSDIPAETPKPISTFRLRDIGTLLAKPKPIPDTIAFIDICDNSSDGKLQDPSNEPSVPNTEEISKNIVPEEQKTSEKPIIQPEIENQPNQDSIMDVDEISSKSNIDVDTAEVISKNTVQSTVSITDIKEDESTKSTSKMDIDSNIKPTVEVTSKQVEITKESNDIIPIHEDKTILKDGVEPSTSKTDIEVQPSTSGLGEPQSTTSATAQERPDVSDDVPEQTDSLGLLAESSRVMEDDEEPEEDDDNDDDDDFYQEDESSNQMTADHSEDSNAQQSETDIPKDQERKETDIESPQVEEGQTEFNFEGEVAVCEQDGELKDKDGDMDMDQVVEDENDVSTNKIADEVTETKPNEEVKEDESKQDIETVKLSDTSDNELEQETTTKPVPSDDTVGKKETAEGAAKSSPCKKLSITKQNKVLNYVDLEESSEDEIQEVNKVDPTPEKGTTITLQGNEYVIPAEVEVTSIETTDDKQKDSSPQKEAATEVPSTTEAPQVETKASEDSSKQKPKFGLEVFNLDSDEEETAPPQPKELTALEIQKARENNKCINFSCKSTSAVYYAADASAVTYYDAERKRRAVVCEDCAEAVARRTRSLVDGIKDFTPLFELDIGKESSELVEISDSDSDDGTVDGDTAVDTIGEAGASFIEKELAKAFNETWLKYNMDSRLTEAQDTLNKEIKKLEDETAEIDALLSECQTATDKLRNELYAAFEQDRHELPPLSIYDTPTEKYIGMENVPKLPVEPPAPPETRSKRRLSSASETPPKRPAIPLGYTPLDSDKAASQETKGEPTVENTKADDDKDISVLKVSAESAPSDLPPPGELSRPPLRPDTPVYAMRNTFGSWARARLLEVQGRAQVPGASQNFTICRVKMFSRNQTKTKLLPARCLAYNEPADVRMTIGTRVIALFKDPMAVVKRDTFYSGIIAEVPNPVNNYRYLVFFDDGYAQYVSHSGTRLVCECSPLVWEEVHPYSREFVRKYLVAYPERPMVRLHAGQSLKTEWNGKWWPSRVISVDASLVQVHFEEDDRTEWIYRGSTRLAPLYLELQAAERQRARPMPRTKAQPRVNMPYVEYTRSDEQTKPDQPPQPPPAVAAHEREIRQRAVAKKSTAAPQQPPAVQPDSVTSRVVYYTPKNAVKPYKMTPHACGPHCKRKDTLALADLRTYNPLAKPLLSGWERQIVRYNGHKEVMYRAPCGRRLRSMRELHRYLRLLQSDLPVDLFDFTPQTHCLAEFVLNKCLVGKKDLSHGKENVPVPCVNYYDESLPEFCSYNTERTPTAGVPLNLDPEFLCGCDCTDDCEDKTKCACWKMTLEGARTIGLTGDDVGYVYKRLPEPLPSGIYECNSRCKCKHTCLNRVAQHPLQLKLQVFKTLNRGWGIRALNDVPKGSFLCVYAGNLLTDATANMDGLNEGDEYLAELDYIEVVEQMKEGYEEEIPEEDKSLDKKQSSKEESEPPSSSDEEPVSKHEEEDGDFYPGAIGMGLTEFSKRLRKRDRGKKDKEEKDDKKERKDKKEKESEKPDDDCITISDDEEVREPSRFTAQAGMVSNEFVSKYKSVRALFGKDEACYIMDAKVQGNIGRYLNHSCMPNVFVQNVFVDTHDPRFPWVSFFALSHIKAGTELTWNYNYDVGSVPGKALYCYCGAPNCRGRLL